MKETVTLWQFIQAGGWAMLILGLLSVVALAIILYDFMTIKVEGLIPTEFAENLIRKLEIGQFQEARSMCDKKPHIIAAIARQLLIRSLPVKHDG